MDYQNKYGSVTILPITKFQPIRKIKRPKWANREASPPFPGMLFDMDTAEKIGLITGMNNIQLPFVHMDVYGKLRLTGDVYLILQDTNKTGALARFENLNFVSDVNPQEELAYLARGKLSVFSLFGF